MELEAKVAIVTGGGVFTEVELHVRRTKGLT